MHSTTRVAAKDTQRIFPFAAFADHLKPGKLLPTLLESSINTLFLSSPQQSDALTSLYREFDLEFGKKHTGLIPYKADRNDGRVSFNLQDSMDSEAPLTVVDQQTRDAGKSKPIVYSGIAHNPGQLNPFVIPVLHAPRGTFVGDLDADQDDGFDQEDASTGGGGGGKSKLKPVVAGKDAGLVSVFQSRENVRFGWAGVDMLKDDVWTDSTLNPEFISSLTSWIFQESGVVKVVSTEHYRQSLVNENGTAIRETRDRYTGYTVKDLVTYEIGLAQYEPLSDSWKPIEINDMQLDFTMLDPHIRTSLPPVGPLDFANEQGTLYQKEFMVPDRHGVFKFVVDWWRPGYTFIHASTTTSVVPYRHDQYPRFIQGAWPFYTAAFMVSGSFIVFCVLWLTVGAQAGDAVVKRDGKKQR